MKKLKSLKLMLLAVVALLGMNAFAQTSSGIFTITLSGNDATITGFKADATASDVATLTIPATLPNGVSATPYNVVGIAANAFKNSNGTLKAAITSVTIADTKITSIGNNAFDGLANLTTVTIGKAVTTIGIGAFNGCSKLATVNFPADCAVNSIGVDAFKGTIIAHLNLGNTKLTTINNMFGSTYAYGAVKYTDGDVNDAYSAKYYNSTLAGAKSTSDYKTFYTAAEAATANAGKDGVIATTTTLTAELIAALEALGSNETYEVNDNPTAGDVILYNSSSYITADGAIHAGDGKDLYTQDEADTYNASLPGAKTTADNRVDAVSAKAVTSLTEVTLPSTWQYLGVEGESLPGAFENCTKLAKVNFTTPTLAAAVYQEVRAKAFLGCPIVDLNMTDTKIQVVPSDIIVDGTMVNSALKTVTFPTALTTIEAKAFYQCAQLSTVTFPTDCQLTTIENNVFGITPSLTEISLAACYKLNTFGAYTPFVPTTGKNTELTKITLPAKRTIDKVEYPFQTIGTALANLSALTTIEGLTDITAVGDGAFTNDAALTSLTLPTTVTSITGKPFGGCTKLASLTVEGQTGNKVTTLTVGTDGTNLFDDNTTLKTVKFTNNVNATFDDDAFKNSTGIETLEIAKGAEIKGGTLATGSFVVAENASIALGKISVVNGDGFITVGDGTKAATVTIDAVNANVANNSIVVGKVAVTVGTTTANNVAVAASKTVGLDFFGEAATSLTFTGKIQSVFTAYSAANNDLTEINLGSVVVSNENTFPSAMFSVDRTVALTINWEPADANAKKIFAQNAFKSASEATEANRKVTLNTTTAVAALYGNVESNLYNVIFVAEAETQEITVAGPSTYKYGKFFVENGDIYKIAKDQDGAKVVVYEAYVDKDDNNTIYVNQLRLIDGFFYVKGVNTGLDGAGTAVIVKSDSEAPVVATKTLTDKNSLNYTAAGKPVNEIICMNEEGGMLGSLLKTATVNTVSNADYTLYAMMKPETNGLAWKQFKSSITLPQLTFYVRCAPDASAPALNVVFTDGSQDENTTGIKDINANEQMNGEIYNLQGIRVNGAKKGMYIMNGKKFIQK